MEEAPVQGNATSLAEQWSLQHKVDDVSVVKVEDESPKVESEDVKPNDTIKDANPNDLSENVNPVSAPTEEPVSEKSDESPSSDESSKATEPEEEEKDSKEKTSVKLETAPADFRFPTTNQTRHCFTRYIEYHRCINVKGEGAPECDKFAKYYRSLCPSEWVERWNEQRENGTFPGPL